MTRAARWMPFVFAVAVLPAQDAAEALWKKVEKGEPLIELKWRRDAKGSFEYAVAASAEPQWTPWFGPKLFEVYASTGAPGLAGLLANPGDLVALTDGVRHLQRIGVATTPGELAAFVNTPLPEAMRTTALLDRMVAIDLLRASTDASAKPALGKLAAAAALPKELRERAVGEVSRRKLDATTWPMCEAPDVVAVWRPAKMPSMRYVMELGRFTGYVACVSVLTMLKAPNEKDFLMSETETESIAEFPFELARRIGNHRCDEIGFAFRMPTVRGESPALAACAAGAFDVAGVAAGAAAVPVSCERNGDAVELGFGEDGLVGRLAAERFDLRLASSEVAPRPELAKLVLANADAVFVAHVPAKSHLLTMAAEFDLPGIERADLAVTLREKDVSFDLRLGTADADAAKKLAAAIQAKLKELGWVGAVAMLAITVDESMLRVVPEDREVRVAVLLPRAAIPTLEQAKAHALKQARQQRDEFENMRDK